MALTQEQRNIILASETNEQRRILRATLHGVIQTLNDRLSVLKAQGRVSSANLNAWYAFRDSWVRWIETPAKENNLQLLSFYEDTNTWGERITGWENAPRTSGGGSSTSPALGPEGPTIGDDPNSPKYMKTALVGVAGVIGLFAAFYYIDRALEKSERRARFA